MKILSFIPTIFNQIKKEKIEDPLSLFKSKALVGYNTFHIRKSYHKEFVHISVGVCLDQMSPEYLSVVQLHNKWLIRKYQPMVFEDDNSSWKGDCEITELEFYEIYNSVINNENNEIVEEVYYYNKSITNSRVKTKYLKPN